MQYVGRQFEAGRRVVGQGALVLDGLEGYFFVKFMV